MQSFLFVLASLLIACEAFRATKPLMRLSVLKMSQDEEPFQPEETAEGQLKMDMNRLVRLGRSKDQDGKSNIWSIEPTMEVDETEGDQSKKNLVLGAALIGGAIACLPLFSFFSKFMPDPADF